MGGGQEQSNNGRGSEGNSKRYKKIKITFVGGRNIYQGSLPPRWVAFENGKVLNWLGMGGLSHCGPYQE